MRAAIGPIVVGMGGGGTGAVRAACVFAAAMTATPRGGPDVAITVADDERFRPPSHAGAGGLGSALGSELRGKCLRVGQKREEVGFEPGKRVQEFGASPRQRVGLTQPEARHPVQGEGDAGG